MNKLPTRSMLLITRRLAEVELEADIVAALRGRAEVLLAQK